MYVGRVDWLLELSTNEPCIKFVCKYMFWSHSEISDKGIRDRAGRLDSTRVLCGAFIGGCLSVKVQFVLNFRVATKIYGFNSRTKFMWKFLGIYENKTAAETTTTPVPTTRKN